MEDETRGRQSLYRDGAGLMTSTIRNGAELSKDLKEAFLLAESAKIAVAFWGIGAADLFESMDGQKIEIICNLKMGGTNPGVIRRLIDNGVRVYAHDQLHAKFGMIGPDFCFIGSSNVSANGLGMQGREIAGWEELNVVLRDAASVAECNERFEDLKEAACRVTPDSDLLSVAEALWQNRRQFVSANPPKACSAVTLWKALQTDPERFRDVPLYLTLSRWSPDEESEVFSDAAHNHAVESFGASYGGYENWKGLPKVGTFIDFEKKSTAPTLKFNGFWQRSQDRSEFKFEGSTFQLAFSTNSVLGFAPPAGQELTELKSAFLAFLNAMPKPQSDSEQQCIEAYTFANWLRGRGEDHIT